MLTAHAAYADTAAPAPGDETIVISKFEVSANPSHGYSASESMSATRVNTKIIDLPFSTVNLTDQYFKDFGTNILDENMTQIGGLTALSIGGNFFLRGFNSTSQLRDGFYRLGRYGQSNVERIEVIRGPNAAIYGRTAPGGMVNFISVQPKKANTQDLIILNGSYDQRQENLKVTGSLDKSHKTYYVLSLDQTTRRFDGAYDHIRNNEDFVSVRHDFSDTSHLTGTAEYFLQIQHAPQAAAPEVFTTRAVTPDNAATTHAIGLDTALASYNAFGPHSELNRGNISYTLEYDKTFNDVWSIRTAANNYRERRWDFNQDTPWTAITLPTVAGGPLFDTRGAIPNKGLIQEDGGGIQSDLLAHYFLLHHSVEGSSLLTIDFNDYYRYDPTYNTGPDAALTAWGAGGNKVALTQVVSHGQVNWVPSGPIAYFPENFNWTGNSTSLLTRRRTTSVGGNFRQQTTFFKGRLITFVGVRYDAVRFNQRDYTVQFPDVGYNGLGMNPTTGAINGTGQVRRYFHETKPNLGFNVKVTKNVHLYGSYSESYFVDQTSRPAVIAGWTAVTKPSLHFIPSPFKPETADGWDYGVKVSFFDERLNATLGGYYADRKNVAVSDVETDPVTHSATTVTVPAGNQVDKGAEFDLNWLPTDNLSITASAAVVNAKYKSFGTGNPEAMGRSVAFVSPENGSVSGKYTFSSGPAKGLDLEASVTYVSSTPCEQPNAGDTVNPTTLAVTSHTDQWMLRTPSSTVWDFGVHYMLPWQWHHIQQTVGLTVHNAFNLYYLKDGSNATLTNNQADSRSLIVTYEIAHF
jgi:outer membrane receptor protein involved in Fe transport